MTETTRVARALENFVEQAVKEITASLTEELFVDTPEKTGYAESSWIPSIGRRLPNQDTPEDPTPGQVSFQRNLQLSRVEQVRTNYDLSDGPVFVGNVTDYIVDLNEGTSTQAPTAYVQSSMAKAVLLALRGLAARGSRFR